MQERCVARLATAGGQTGKLSSVAGDMELTSLRGWHLESQLLRQVERKVSAGAKRLANEAAYFSNATIF